MRGKRIFVATLGLILFTLGLLGPQFVLLDMPFGLAFYAVDLLGMWKQGLLWAPSHRILAIICFIVWPLFVVTLLSYAIIFIASRLWSGRQKNSHLYAVIFVIAVFALIFTVRVKPASYYVSYFGYATANY